jgi:hypothetical protein
MRKELEITIETEWNIDVPMWFILLIHSFVVGVFGLEETARLRRETEVARDLSQVGGDGGAEGHRY